MKFRLTTVLWTFALFASAMAAFGVWGIGCALCLVLILAVAQKQPKQGPWVLAILFVLGLGVASLIVPAYNAALRSALLGGCTWNLTQLVTALDQYQLAHGKLPQDIVDDTGLPLLSWRVKLLPYLGEQGLYNKFRLDEPWYSPHNRTLWAEMPEVFVCPACDHAVKAGTIRCSPSASNYFAVVGPQTVWAESVAGNWQQPTKPQPGAKIILVETVMPDTCWMQPIDLSVEQALEVIRTNRRKGHLGTIENFLTVESLSLYTHAADVYGGVDRLYNDAYVDDLLDRFVVGERPNYDWSTLFENMSWEESNRTVKWRRIYALSLFVIISFLPLLRKRQAKETLTQESE